MVLQPVVLKMKGFKWVSNVSGEHCLLVVNLLSLIKRLAGISKGDGFNLGICPTDYEF